MYSRYEWQNLKRVEVIQRPRTLAKVLACLDAGCDVAAGGADGGGDVEAVG
jgi:hypothetical protein